MKKRFLVLLITVATLLLGLSVFFAACDGDAADGDKAEYSVTVLSPDEEPLSGVTVSWLAGSKTAGSAETGEDGKAAASLPRASYLVSLSGYYEGYSYTSVSVSASQRNITLTLSAIRTKYTVAVTDKAGDPAENVTVTWTKNGAVAASVKTNGNGTAVCELDYGEYYVVLSDLPDANIYDGAKSVNGSDPFLSFELKDGQAVSYSVSVRSEGGLLFKEQSVQIFNELGILVSAGKTNESGEYRFSVMQGHYTATAAALPDGYTAEEGALTPENLSTEVILHSEIISSAPAQNKRYVMGDIFHDYTFTTPYELNGAIWSKSVSEILRDKEALIINNWGTGCGNCMVEMPDMQEIYEKYQDRIELVAVNNYPSSSGFDSDKTIIDFATKPYATDKYYTFPMMRDVNGFTAKFGITGWPTTIVIDRYGAIARIEVGAITSAEAWERMILKYVGEGYTQTFTPGASVSDSIVTEVAKPDVVVPDNHYELIAEAMNDKNLFPNGASIVWYGETEYEYAWPFVLSNEFDDEPDPDLGSDVYMYSSNTGKANSMSFLYATVTVEAGKVLHFDYYAQTEENDDVLSIVWDGKIVKRISGDSKGWQTCYLYADLTGGSHTLSMAYIKDGSANVGKDNVYFKRFGFAEIEDIPGSADMLRSAAYGIPESGATVFPYYIDTEIGEDGYYYVDLSKLQNSQFAGNDPKPMLFANLMGATSWNANSVSAWAAARDEKTGEYLIDCNFTIGGVKKDYRPVLIKYLQAAASSYVENCVPVNRELHDILVEFMNAVSRNNSHGNEWLEVCYYYSHYGEGKPIGNPILGVMEQTAIPVEEGTTTADLNRNMYPFPVMIFAFTPNESAVYELKSMIPAELAATKAAQVWLYDDTTSPEEPLAYCGDGHFTRGGENEHNFEVYYYMTAGHKYYVAVAYLMAERGTYDFTITKIGQSKTVMIPCSEDTYDMVLDNNGDFTGEICLAGAIKYQKDEDGYYRAKNPDGTVGDYIYLDVKYASTTSLGTIPISRLVDKMVQDPVSYTNLDYKFFDFRYRVLFIRNKTEEGEIINYDPQVDWTQYGAKYKDYTETVKGWIAEAQKNDGLIKVNDEIVNFLKLYLEMRCNAVYIDGATQEMEVDSVLDNEWLKFCWYNRTYNEANP